MKVNVWSVISKRGCPGIVVNMLLNTLIFKLKYLYKIKQAFTQNLNGRGYFGILANHLIPFAKSVYGEGAILHQDNSSIHRERECVNLLNQNHLTWISLKLY